MSTLSEAHEAIQDEVQRRIPKDWESAYIQMRAAENSRNDLMRVNQELREKIGSLERGQIELIYKLQNLPYYDINQGHV